MESKTKKTLTSINLSLIILSIFSFGFFIGEVGVVSANAGTVPFKPEIGQSIDDIARLWDTTPEKILELNPEYFGGSEIINVPIEGSTGVPGAINPTNPGTSKNFISSHLGFQAGYAADALATGATWAVGAYLAGSLVGSFLGFDKDNTKAVSTALAAGAGVYKGLATYGFEGGGTFLGSEGLLATYPGYIGLGVAAIVFVAMYKETKTETVTFSCLPWQSPTGSTNDICEQCNDDNLPCSEYRCKSLGQNCILTNEGTTEEKCVSADRNDVSQPIITPNELELTTGHSYRNVKTSPPGPGFEIVRTGSSNGCLQPFTALEFGITTNEPSQCKIDFNHTTSFEEMATYFGGSNLFSYNHTEKFSLPNTDSFANSSLVLQNGKDLTFFIRCMDAAGNENTEEYAVKLCIDPSPDTTPPQIKATSIRNNGCVAEGSESANVEFYTNEPSTCRWDYNDKDYDLMNNEMVCQNKVYELNAQQLYTCTANLGGIAKDSTDYYIRCKDKPGKEESSRNKMGESYKFNLRSSNALAINLAKPNETIFGGVNPTPVELFVQTSFGCNDGQAVCFYSQTGKENDFIRFLDTNTEDAIHTQRQDLVDGNYDYTIRCVDEGGNVATTKTSFEVDIDTNPPVIARIYEEENFLKIVTQRNSECAYTTNSCDFTIDEATEMVGKDTKTHITDWDKTKTYYIKCRDEFKNEGATCSAIVRPSTNFL